MATLANLRTQFPEFNGVSDALCQSMLNAADLEIDKFIWGDYGTTTLARADQGQLYLACHKLAVTPFGQNAKMVQPTGKQGWVSAAGWGRTTYGQEYFLLLRSVSAGYRVC